MVVSVEVHKIIKFTICDTAFFTSGGGDDEVLVTFLLFEKFIKDASSMCISFSVKHPQTFWKSRMGLSNMSRTIVDMYTCLFKPQLVIKT